MLTLTASGSVSDYTDSAKSSLQQKVSNVAGVDKSFVTIRVTAASVRITATIAVPASMTPDAVQTSLSSTLGTAADASEALGVTVEEKPTVALVVDDPLRPRGSGSFSCDGGCVGGIVGGCFVPVLVCILWLGGAFAKCGWPSPLKKPRGCVANQMVHGWGRGRCQEMGDLGGQTRPSRSSLQTAPAGRPITEARRARIAAAESATARVVRPPSHFSTTVPMFQQVVVGAPVVVVQ